MAPRSEKRRQAGPRKWGRGALSVAFILCLPAVLSSSAAAATNPLASGTTTIHFGRPFLATLKRSHVKLTAVAPAAFRGASLLLPVEGGELDSDSGLGSIASGGRLELKGPRGAVILRDFSLKTTSTPLTAVVGGAQIKLASGSGRSLPREGFGQGVRYRSLKVSKNLAVRLNTKLRLRGVFAEGQPLGSLQSATQPATVGLASTGKLNIELTPAMAAKLAEHFVSVNPISPTEHPGPFTFPIAPLGAISPDASTGTLKTEGSIELLKLGSGQIVLHEFWVGFGEASLGAELNFQPSPPHSGKHPPGPVLGLSMETASVSSDPAARTISVSGATATLSGTLAQDFDEAFAEGKEDFRPGEALGTLSFFATAA